MTEGARRGFPLGALAVLGILRMRGAKLCMVFHDIRNDQAHGWKNRLRVAFQYHRPDCCRLASRVAHEAAMNRPITEAGVLLVDPGGRMGIAEALKRVLCNAKFRDEMRQRSLTANQKYFSWNAITEQFLFVLVNAAA